jgi:hypothetical protein
VAVLREVRLRRAWFRVYGIPGATASGILNPKSKTQSAKEFAARLDRAPRWQQVLLLLGEVDCGFLIWLRAERHGLSIEQQLSATLDSYTTFIEGVIDRGFARVLVLSVPLPTISDSPSEWGYVAKQRAEVSASRAERTQLTLRFNAELRKRCDGIGAVFVDATSEQLDPLSGVIDARFLRDNSRDHHLATDPYSELIGRELARIGSSPAAAKGDGQTHRGHALA